MHHAVSSTSPNLLCKHDWIFEIGIGCDDIFIDPMPRDVENDNIGSKDTYM